MAGHRVCVVVWLVGALFVCVDSSVFWGVAVLVEGLVWLVEEFLVHLCGGFALFIGGFMGGCLF
jgi:hypothetical protein